MRLYINETINKRTISQFIQYNTSPYSLDRPTIQLGLRANAAEARITEKIHVEYTINRE